jgi:hypothetical protein
VVIGTQSTIYLVVFLHMVNMGVRVEICAREVVLMVNNNVGYVLYSLHK